MMIWKENRQIELIDAEKALIKSGWGNETLENVSLSKIIYNSEGYDVEGFICKPKDSSVKYPLILWNRGGDEDNGKLDNFLAWGILGEIASWGYVVIASQYRKNDEFGGKEINDVMNILKIGMLLEEYDGMNIGVEGWSRGGMMTYQLLTKLKFIKCAVVVAGLADLRTNFERNLKLKNKFNSLFPNASEERINEEIRKRSAVEFHKDIDMDTPILLIHGTNDNKVLYEDSVNMYMRLVDQSRADINFETIQKGDHYLSRNRKEVQTLRKQWFDKYLKLN
ncbi:MAG: prolyl oligopeptidase family serine peptidase [Ignavibacteriota bacterium]|nr:prolyl oligopeptidase family serine peptidase [Ignavibacteriota bacterium]